MPELKAVLAALHVPPAGQLQALSLIDAPRALRCLRAEARTTLLDIDQPAIPAGGDLLRAMRHRQRFSIEQVAAHLHVPASTVSRWERSERRPSSEHWDALFELLGAYPEERAALRADPLLLAPAAPQRLLSYEEIDGELERCLNEPLTPTHAALMELTFVMLESQAARLALRQPPARGLLAKIHAWHANHLSSFGGREEDVRRHANRVLDLLSGETCCPRFALRALIRLAWVTGESGCRPAPAQALELLQLWLPQARELQEEALTYEGWMLSEMAYHACRYGAGETALSLARTACQAAEGDVGHGDLDVRRLDLAKILLRCGRPAEALVALPAPERERFVEWALVGADALLELGERSAAQLELERAMGLLEAHTLTRADVVAFMRPQVEALARRF